MNVADFLNEKNSNLFTVKPNETIGCLARKLQQKRIGVMVVSHDGQTLEGIISERDIAYSLAERRGELHLLPVSAIMTRRVVTCTPDTKLREVMHLMWQFHVRHVPVVEESRLIGIVSMRNIMEFRLSEIERRSKLVEQWFTASD